MPQTCSAPRLAGDADLAAILRLDRELSPVFAKAQSYAALAKAGGLVLVSVQHEQLAGFAAFSRALDEATVLNVAVHPQARRQGVGKRLLQAGCAWFAQRGCTRTLLEVRASNTAAQALYTALGFQIDGQRRNYYPALSGSGRETAILMSLCHRASSEIGNAST